MKPLGIHLIIDAWQAPPEVLNDADHIRFTLTQAVAAGGATLIELCVHQFHPHGLTATATLAESHIAIHTWPELGYFAADIFFCGQGDPEAARRAVLECLPARRSRVRRIKRGVGNVF
jgi:S-adenosylmethionine decarboxylase